MFVGLRTIEERLLRHYCRGSLVRVGMEHVRHIVGGRNKKYVCVHDVAEVRHGRALVALFQPNHFSLAGGGRGFSTTVNFNHCNRGASQPLYLLDPGVYFSTHAVRYLLVYSPWDCGLRVGLNLRYS